MFNSYYTALVPLLPLFSFILLIAFGLRLPGKWAGYIGSVLTGIAAVAAYCTAWTYFSLPLEADGTRPAVEILSWEWLRFTPLLAIRLGIYVDALSAMMWVVITTVSLMVHIYSLGYMAGEKGFARYFAFLGLFSFSMLGLVVAPNIFQTYIFWELVGVSSYLLIGFYYTKPEAVSASKKAFIVTRFADLGFLIGILILSYFTGTFDFQTICGSAQDAAGVGGALFAPALQASFLGLSALSWAMLLIFMGCAGKSALFPLHIWLPDAMEGPTPVSALIHAATMVVAGVFLVARLFPVYALMTPGVLEVIAYVAAFTSLYAAVVACVQTDIKRVLAFSTISQIGFMMVALGVSGYGGHAGEGYTASLFHLFTHAFFKALLFLCAGAIIHTVHSNEMKAMGGLRRYMPVTHLCFLVGCLAIAGIPPFSGFFSKDGILAAAFAFNPCMGILMTAIAGLTAFYMFRLYCRIFHGPYSSDTAAAQAEHAEAGHHTPHEAPAVMTAPLVFLAVLSLLTGFIPFGDFLSSDGLPHAFPLQTAVAVCSVLTALVGIGIALYAYGRGPRPAFQRMAEQPNAFLRAAKNRFYIDRFYLFITHRLIFQGISTALAWFDRHVIDGVVFGSGKLTEKIARKIRIIQSGQLQTYAPILLLGVLCLIGLVLYL
ncbi:MAG: NADH-quinone oxidoreductase subunit L [Bacteroidales bacterium]|nr:NADH-quinone oxidoreductase subunit L [Bacteroidales bacterium]